MAIQLPYLVVSKSHDVSMQSTLQESAAMAGLRSKTSTVRFDIKLEHCLSEYLLLIRPFERQLG